MINLDDARPTVLTGLNGTGKSTILKLVSAASRADMNAIALAPLAAITLNFSGDMPPFSARRSTSRQRLYLNWGNHSDELDISWSRMFAQLPEWSRDALSDIAPDSTEDEITDMLMRYAAGSGLSYNEIVETRNRIRKLLESRRDLDPPPWMEEFQAKFSVLFISDQRLIVEPESPPRRNSPHVRHSPNPSRVEQRSVELASADIASRIRSADSRYARVSQDQDRTFPNAVIVAMKQAENISKERVERLVSEVNQKRERLRLVGLLDRRSSYEPDLDRDDFDDAHIRSVMATIMRSTQRKLDVFNDLASRLTSYKEFLDRRYAPKVVNLNRRHGIKIELPNRTEIRPSSLSSGEQQMAVLAYEILFRTEENTVVIIDEPEISLHVLWQDTLIDDLSEMGAASNLQFLMATHSPIILASHSELERSLDEPNA